MSCFSEECGFCSACSGDAGNKVVEYPLPKELYKMETGKEFTAPPEPKNPRDLLRKMMYVSSRYRIRLEFDTWGKLFKRLVLRERIMKKNKIMYRVPDGIFWSIYNSHIEFVKGCTEEGIIYGEKRCLRPENNMIYTMINKGEVDINSLGGKVVCKGGGLFDLDALKKQSHSRKGYRWCPLKGMVVNTFLGMPVVTRWTTGLQAMMKTGLPQLGMS